MKKNYYILFFFAYGKISSISSHFSSFTSSYVNANRLLIDYDERGGHVLKRERERERVD
jgi:hypothetical protein